MKNIYFILVSLIIIVFIIGVYILIFNTSSPQSNYMPYHTLQVEFSTDEQSHVKLEKIELQKGYPNFYNTNLQENFWLMEIYDSYNRKIFSGKTPRLQQMVYELMKAETREIEGTMQTSPISPLIVYLPFYPTAQKIVISDEKNDEKMNIALENYHFTIPKETINACGNGMCDSAENMFSCYKDCKRNMEFLWKKVKENYLP